MHASRGWPQERPDRRSDAHHERDHLHPFSDRDQGVLAAEHQWDEGQVAQMLEDERAGSFSFDETIFAWRDWEITAERIHARRKFVTSFGSCSFDEPREDLRGLNLL